MAATQYSPEFTLLLECCQAHLQTNTQLSEIDQSRFDETLFIRLVKNHRVSSFVLEQLDRLPLSNEAKSDVKKINKESRQRALAQCKGLIDIHDRLKQLEVPFIVIKGALLSKKLYDDVAYRSSRDIDILIQPRALLKTYEYLLANGFRQLEPQLQLTKKNFKAYLRLTNQISFGTEAGQMVEVHWALFKGKSTFPYSQEDVWNLTQKVSLLGREFLTLQDFICFQFLYVHGARHQYTNLFWLIDVATLGKKMSGESRQLQVEFARKKDLDRQLALSMALSEHLLKTPFALLGEMDHKTAEQLTFIQQVIEAGVNQKSAFWDNLKLLNYRLGLRKSWAYKAAHFKLFSLKDYSALPLPSYLHWTYFFLRPFILLWRYGRTL